MIALIQRVSQARVRADTRVAGEIGAGIVAFVCAERGDSELDADTLIEKLLGFRVFADASGRMNLSLRDVNGGLLLVSQFTLAADTDSGTRPGFSRAAPPDEGRRLFDHFVARARVLHPFVASGEFGAMMQVELINDGPATFWLQSKRRNK